MSKLAQPVRVALTGGTASPGIFEVMMLLGRQRTVARLKKAIDLMR
jgi:glutamyl-tRNA synthetase